MRRSGEHFRFTVLAVGKDAAVLHSLQQREHLLLLMCSFPGDGDESIVAVKHKGALKLLSAERISVAR